MLMLKEAGCAESAGQNTQHGHVNSCRRHSKVSAGIWVGEYHTQDISASLLLNALHLFINSLHELLKHFKRSIGPILFLKQNLEFPFFYVQHRG